jgi:hypothetical protein
MSFYQIALPIGTLVYLLQVFVIKSIIQYKRTGVNPRSFLESQIQHTTIFRRFIKQ